MVSTRPTKLAALITGTALLALAGCASFLPLPLSPIPIMTKAFPAVVVDARGVQRAYTIKANTFAYPQVGLEVTRPDATDWEFKPVDNGVLVQVRDGVGATEPRPSFVAQMIPLAQGTDVEAAKGGDLAKLIGGGATVSTVPRFIEGKLSDAWTITQADPKMGLVAKVLRIYITLPDLLVLLTASADVGTFKTFGPKFEQMLSTIKLPAGTPGATPVPPPPLSGPLAARINGSLYTDPSTGGSLSKANDNWVYGLSGPLVAIRRGGVAQGVDPTPQLTVTLLKSKDVDIAKVKEAGLAGLKADGIVPTTKARTVGGVAGEQWEFTQPDVLGKPTTVQRLFLQNGLNLAVLETTTLTTYAPAVATDFNTMIDSFKLPVGLDDVASGAPATGR